ncbi:MAG: HAMP domain-containing sensor histidine kinase [Planctomycetales bacterium]|jgi:signal transduction histidine kinase|nr:HAMP domain-containing sensor histidine kinase [Planctomycetales bacterium]
MSYNNAIGLLGETSLERKCRLLFGGGLLLLISGSFWIYARQTQGLVFVQNTDLARSLVASVIIEKHASRFEKDNNDRFEKDNNEPRNIERMSRDLKPEDLKEIKWALLGENPTTSDASGRFIDNDDARANAKISAVTTEFAYENSKLQEFRFYAAVCATEACITCHYHNKNQKLRVGDRLGLAKISFPLKKTYRSRSWNNAILMSTAIVTAFLAMTAAYAIVRFVIVKPVLHLKEVSDAITRGDLEQRADIRTGDEFEELSHAFNRMLRHLTTVQEDLKKLNSGFESKVDELAQVNLRLYEMNKLKNEFLATMSHELRTPLNSILGFSDVLLSNGPTFDDKQRRYLGHIQSSGRTLLNLINDVLDLAKIESGKMELHPVEFSLYEVIERTVGAMAALAEKKNIDLHWQSDSGLPLLFQDLGKLQQILSNLLSNALKFTPEGGRVVVRVVLTDPERVSLIVEDTGIGIPLIDQERIFEKFRQGAPLSGQRGALTREYEGTGLGLSITKELSKLLGGEIRLHSEFGKGSVFTVGLPIRVERLTPALEARTKPVAEAVDLQAERPSAIIRQLNADSPRKSEIAGDSATSSQTASES